MGKNFCPFSAFTPTSLLLHIHVLHLRHGVSENSLNHKVPTTMRQLVDIAILAYRNGRYREAIELLIQVADADADSWLAKLYLAKSYEDSGRMSDAHRVFEHIANVCPDEHLRLKAGNSLPGVQAEMRSRFCRETQANQKANTDQDDIFGFGN